MPDVVPSGFRCKIRFDLSQKTDEWPPTDAETLWATQIDPGVFVLNNVPFYALGVALADVVAARYNPGAPSIYDFERVLSHSGHSTYRIFRLTDSTNDFELWWSKLAVMGCSYEQANTKLYAVDIPPGVDVSKAYRILEEGERRTVWDFEEGYFFVPE